jgi:hypothetical protein
MYAQLDGSRLRAKIPNDSDRPGISVHTAESYNASFRGFSK